MMNARVLNNLTMAAHASAAAWLLFQIIQQYPLSAATWIAMLVLAITQSLRRTFGVYEGKSEGDSNER
jgi:hypothetical protein